MYTIQDVSKKTGLSAHTLRYYEKEGLITGVAVGDTVDHTPSFLGLITQDALNGAYIGRLASSTLTADAVTGATFSSDAVL